MIQSWILLYLLFLLKGLMYNMTFSVVASQASRLSVILWKPESRTQVLVVPFYWRAWKSDFKKKNHTKNDKQII